MNLPASAAAVQELKKFVSLDPENILRGTSAQKLILEENKLKAVYEFL